MHCCTVNIFINGKNKTRTRTILLQWSAIQWNTMNCSALHCTALKHSELLCTTLYRTALHCTSHCTLPYFISLHYTSLQCSTLDCDLYFLLQAFRHNTGKVMDKQPIFMFGFITIAVFVQIKGNSFQAPFFFFYHKAIFFYHKAK